MPTEVLPWYRQEMMLPLGILIFHNPFLICWQKKTIQELQLPISDGCRDASLHTYYSVSANSTITTNFTVWNKSGGGIALGAESIQQCKKLVEIRWAAKVSEMSLNSFYNTKDVMKHTNDPNIKNQTCSFCTLVSRHLKLSVFSLLAARSQIIFSVNQYGFLSIKLSFFLHLSPLHSRKSLPEVLTKHLKSSCGVPSLSEQGMLWAEPYLHQCKKKLKRFIGKDVLCWGHLKMKTSPLSTALSHRLMETDQVLWGRRMTSMPAPMFFLGIQSWLLPETGCWARRIFSLT